MNDNRPIGIFDSGLGGLSIYQALKKKLPNETFIYVADTAFVPYGLKSKEIIVQRAVLICDFLFQQGCKLIVVACNTATTNAIHHLRKKFPLPFIGIEPAIKPAALNSKTGAVGVLATQGTLTSSLFEKTSKNYSESIQVHSVVGKGLVESVENNTMNTPETIELLNSYLQPMVSKNIDRLVLGCTHYHFLIPNIIKLIPDTVEIVDNIDAISKQTQHILIKNELISSKPQKQNSLFYSSDKSFHYTLRKESLEFKKVELAKN